MIKDGIEFFYRQLRKFETHQIGLLYDKEIIYKPEETLLHDWLSSNGRFSRNIESIRWLYFIKP